MVGVGDGTGALGSVIGSLTTLLSDEYTLIKSVRKDIAFVERELRRMQILVNTLADMEELDKVAKDFKGSMRDLSYDMKKCIDRFMLRLGNGDAKPVFVKRTPRLLKKRFVRHSIRTKIKELELLLNQDQAAQAQVSEEDESGATPPHELTVGFLNRITNNFSEERIIGRGGHGIVYKGVQDNGEYIAVKKLHLMPGFDDEELKNDFNNLMWVQHQNTIRFVGYCHHTAYVLVEHNGKHVPARVEERSLCSEYLQGGSLDKHLSNEPCELSWDTCYKIIKGICEGLHYLHKGLEYPIYHLELKPTKFLLDKDMMPKIGGFGFSRLSDLIETSNTLEVTGTSVYMPPEYTSRRLIIHKFDVYSLGVIILQIMAGKERYTKRADIPPEEFIELVYGFWVNGMQGKISKHTSHEVRTCIEIALKCVESNQVKRPTINEIIQKLNKIDIVECSSIGQLYRAREFAFEFLERITNGFSEQNIVGRGGYGVIYKGVLDNGEEIAVKKLHQTLPPIDDKLFKKEVNNVMRAQHENIVRLVGYCHHTSPIIVEHEGKHISASVIERVICFEYMQGGSLDDQLSAESCKLDWDKCYKIIKGICEGLHYLHNSVTPIYHLDLKPANILLDKDMVAKIGDFGLSRLFDSAQTYMTASQDLKGTLGYMPPEYINGQKISPKFDVFSLGVIIIQIMAGKEGYFNCRDTPPKDFVEHVHEKWRVRLQATMSSHVSEEVRTCIEIALKCVEDDRTRRPTITHIVNELSNIGIAKSSPVGQVQATMSSHVSEEVRTCIEIVLKCVEDDRTRRPTIAQIVNELSKIGIAKSSPISQIFQASFSNPQQTPQTEQGGGHWANKLTALKTLLLSTHFKHWLFLLVAAIAICSHGLNSVQIHGAEALQGEHKQRRLKCILNAFI